jgi:UTP--glucose-1-phosphate uridylyltransferase
MNSVKPVYKAIIPVAGLGTRMLPATKAIPKELLPIYDRPLIEHVVREAIDGGIREIILVTRSGKEAIENHFDAHYELEHRLVKNGKDKILENIIKIIPDEIKISSIRQADALGLGHAILCAKHLINDEPFAVLLPDVLVLDKKVEEQLSSFKKLVNAWEETGIGQIMVEQIDSKKTESYGIANFGGHNSKKFKSISLTGLVEKPSPKNAPSNLAVLGRYILPPNVMDFLARTAAGVGNEIQLTDALDKLIDISGLNGMETDADIYDCGHKMGYLSANIAFGMRDPEIKAKILKMIENI